MPGTDIEVVLALYQPRTVLVGFKRTLLSGVIKTLVVGLKQMSQGFAEASETFRRCHTLTSAAITSPSLRGSEQRKGDLVKELETLEVTTEL